MITRRSFLARGACLAAARGESSFAWPEGKQAALSLTFDDARLSQIDNGLELLDRCRARATFYLVPSRAEQRLEGWKRAVAAGHEIGNHSRTHPCTGNYRFARQRALEDYTLARMDSELEGANADLSRILNVKPISFAYPCGQKFVGRGEETRSYVPLVAKRFLTGRGYLDEAANDPAICDLAQLMGTAFDDLDFDTMLKLVKAAASEGRWLVFVGHEIGKRAFQTTDTGALERLCNWASEPANGIWLDTVANIAKYVQKRQVAHASASLQRAAAELSPPEERGLKPTPAR